MSNANPILGLAGSLATTFLNNRMAQENANTSYNRQKELMSMQSNMNMTNAMNMPGVQAFGLKQAGFNPAMVNGAGTQAAPTVSQGNADMPQTIPFNAQDALLFAQMENIDANTKKVEEETEGVKKQNDITDTANSAAAVTYVEGIDRELADLKAQLRNIDENNPRYAEIEKRISTLEASKAKVNDPSFVGALGIAQGIRSGSEAQKSNFEAVNNYIKGRIDRDVLERQLKDSSVRYALAKLPLAQYREVMARINNIRQLTAESESKEELNDQQIAKLQVDIEQIGDTVLRARLSDENYVRNMISDCKRRLKNNPNDKDAAQELKIWENGLDNLTDTEFRKLKYDVGGGIVKGVATGGAIGGVSSLANKILNGEKGKVDLFDKKKKDLDANKDGQTNIFNKSNNPLESWTDNGALDQNKGSQSFKF